MSAEENKALMRRFIDEVINGKNLAAIDELVAPDIVEHEEGPPGMPGGREGTKQFFGMVFNAFPDLKATLEDVVAEGDRLAVRQTWRGTHKGEFMGVPATGKTVAFQVLDWLRFRDGKATEHWGAADTMALMQQLGVAPPVSQGAQVA
jgi:steroid delta-isomerase-like uncharacterized protein